MNHYNYTSKPLTYAFIFDTFIVNLYINLYIYSSNGYTNTLVFIIVFVNLINNLDNPDILPTDPHFPYIKFKL